MTKQIIGQGHTLIAGASGSYQGPFAAFLAFQEMTNGRHVVQLCDYQSEADVAPRAFAHFGEAVGNKKIADRFRAIAGLTVEDVGSKQWPDQTIFFRDLSSYLPVEPDDHNLLAQSELAKAGFTTLTVISASPWGVRRDLKGYPADMIWNGVADGRKVTLTRLKPDYELVTYQGEMTRRAMLWVEKEIENAKY